MTGAGSQHLSVVVGNGFGSIPAGPTHYSPGRNPTVETLSLDNQLERLRTPQNVEAVEAIAGNFEGAFAVSYAMNGTTHQNVTDTIFSGSPGNAFAPGKAPSSRWYVGTDYLDSTNTQQTVERVLKKCVPLEYQIDYQQDTNTVRETATYAYGDEEKNTSITNSSPTGAAQDTTVPFHGASVDFSAFGAVNNRLQSFTLSFSELSRYHFGADRSPTSAVVGPVEGTFDLAAIYERDEFVESAYGSTGSTSPQDDIDELSTTVELSNANGTVRQFTFGAVPRGYDWSDLLSADTDLTDPVTFDIVGDISIS
jgi:hypothetical protein